MALVSRPMVMSRVAGLEPRAPRRRVAVLVALAFAISTLGQGVAMFGAPPAAAIEPDSPLVIVPNDVATIGEALPLVAVGGTILVREGTHAGGFVIDKALTLEGEGWDTTIIDGAAQPGDAITILATGGVTIRGLKVLEAAPGIGIHLVSAGGNTLDRVWTVGGRFGVSFTNGASNNLVQDSRASNATEWAFEGGDTASSGNTYTRVEAWGSLGGIVAYAGSHGTTVTGAYLHDNGVGFRIGWSSGWSITGSTVTRNGNGIILDRTTGGSISDNDISGNTNDGINLGGPATSDALIQGNGISDNGGAGVRFASGATANVVRDNEIRNNTVGIWVTRNEALPNFGNRIFSNRLIDNTTQAIADEERYGGNAWDDGYPAGGNFWYDLFAIDAMQGPSQDQPGADNIMDIARPIAGANDVDDYPFVVHEAPFVTIGGWQFNPGTGHYYAQVTGRTFASLDSTDSNPAARLVTINNQAEQDWLSVQFPADHLVIGLNDIAQEGTWVWTSGEPVTFTSWGAGEPNDFNPTMGGEDIAVMFWTDPEDFIAWNDVPNIGWHSGIIETATPSTGGVAGTVRSEGGSPLAGAKVVALAWNTAISEWDWAGEATSGPDGRYEITELAPTAYRVMFSCGECEVATQYWNDVPSIDAATGVNVQAGPNVTGIDATMHPAQHAAFTVNLDSRWIGGNGFAQGASLTIERNGEPMALGDIVVDGFGNFWVDDESIAEIGVGNTISVSDGVSTKELVVRGLRVDGIAGNVVSGWAETGPVDLHVWEAGVYRSVAVDTDGSWSVDVSVPGPGEGEAQTTTVGPGDGMAASITDEDGDASQVDHSVPNPHFTVADADNWLQGEEFAPFAAIEITVNGQPVGGDPVATDADGTFWYDNGSDPQFEIAVGDTIVVTDGTVTKTTVLTGLRVDSISDTTISGWAEAGPVFLEVWIDNGLNREVAIGADHRWSIDVSVPGDEDWEQDTTTLGPGSEGAVTETDADGDRTHVDWRVPNPYLIAELTFNGVNGEDFGGPVVVTITDPESGATETWSGAEIGYYDNWFSLSLDEVAGGEEPWRLAPGHVVTVASAGVTRTLTLADLAITTWDLDANTVEGTTNSADPLEIAVGQDDRGASLATTAAGGLWLVDFDDADPPYDLGLFDYGRAAQFDEDGDSTVVNTGVMGPARFAVGPTLQEIVGSDWPDGAIVTLTIDRPALPGDVDFSASVTAGSGCDEQGTCFSGHVPTTGDPNTYFNLNTGTFWVMAGDVVTMTDGTTTKTQLIPDLQPGLGQVDMHVVDADGDSTFVPAPWPSVVLEPAADRVWAGNFAKGSVTLTVERPEGVVVYGQAVETLNVLTRGSWNLDMWTQPIGNLDRPTMALFDLGVFDLLAGDIVTITDGVSTDVSVVADLTVDGISADTDVVSGHAASEVTLHLGEGEDGYWGYSATPDGDGAWSLTFTPGVFPNPMDGLTPGMTGQAIVGNTVVRWTVQSGTSAVVVTADDQTATYGAGPPTLTWTVDHPGVVWTQDPECTTTAVAGSPVGEYPITCTGGVAAGYSVTYVDGILTVVMAPQSIDFAPLPDRTMGDPPQPLAATSSSGLPVTFTATTPSTCKFVARKLALVAAGTCTVVAIQAGDARYLSAPPVVQSFMVNAAASSIVVTSNLATPAFGQSITFTATVTGPAGKPTGSVTFMDGATQLGVRTLSKGVATFATTGLAPGPHSVTAVYGGNASYMGAVSVLPAGVLVVGAATDVTITNAKALARGSTPVGVSYEVRIRVVALSPGSGIPAGTVDVSDGTVACTVTLGADGSGSCWLTSLSAGTKTLTASYLGGTAYLPDSATATHLVRP